jgi:energy-coupling factor transporter ATP-binding protein EcfA2
MANKDIQWKGPVIGLNQQGYPTPVFYDPHTAINMKSRSGGVIITGSPGSGKSQLGMNLAMMSALAGKKTIYVDPKNDALGLIELQDELDGHLQIKDLNEGKKNGSMDPLITEQDPADKVAKTQSLIHILVGNLKDEQEIYLPNKIVDVAYSAEPSMSLLVQRLLRDERSSMAAIGAKLQGIEQADPTMAGLIFKKGHEKTVIEDLEDGLTVITVLGLKMPSADTDPQSYSSKERLSIGIMYLIVEFLLKSMQDPAHHLEPKTVLIDEAWAFIASESGLEAVKSLFRLGRSMNTTCILMTQNISDFARSSGGRDGEGNGSLLNSAATRFAFRAEDDNEARLLCSSLGISYDSFGEDFASMLPGVCVMKDYIGRVSRVYILQQNAKWKHAFETNPLKKLQGMKQ